MYHGFGPEPLAAFDLFRVEDGRVAEHWDALTPVIVTTASGRSQVDGPSQPSNPELTEANRRLVQDFTAKVLVDRTGPGVVPPWQRALLSRRP